MASPLADFVIALGINGRVTSQGSIACVLERDTELAAEVAQEEAKIDKVEAIGDDPTPKEKAEETTGKLIVREEVAVGHVGWHASARHFLSLTELCTYDIAVWFYFSRMGGKHGVAFWLLFIGCLIIYEGFKVLQTWWLGHWAQQYEKMPTSEVRAL